MSVLRVFAGVSVIAAVVASSRPQWQLPADEHLSHMSAADLAAPMVAGSGRQGAANLPASANNAAWPASTDGNSSLPPNPPPVSACTTTAC